MYIHIRYNKQEFKLSSSPSMIVGTGDARTQPPKQWRYVHGMGSSIRCMQRTIWLHMRGGAPVSRIVCRPSHTGDCIYDAFRAPTCPYSWSGLLCVRGDTWFWTLVRFFACAIEDFSAYNGCWTLSCGRIYIYTFI